MTLLSQHWKQWMGDDVEAGVALIGADRAQVRAAVWECRCRNRKQRYHELCAWAAKLASMNYASLAEARQALRSLMSDWDAQQARAEFDADGA